MTHAINLTAVSNHVKKGGLIAYPTEGVWGIGCDPYNEQAVKKILNIKDRGVDKGLVLVAANLNQIERLVNPLSKEAQDILIASCPGPDTWLIPDKDLIIPSWIKGNFDTVAIRVSQHPIVKLLSEQIGLLVSTSANPSGKEPAISQQEVEDYFKNEDIQIVPGELGGQLKPSRIRDLMSQKVIRN